MEINFNLNTHANFYIRKGSGYRFRSLAQTGVSSRKLILNSAANSFSRTPQGDSSSWSRFDAHMFAAHVSHFSVECLVFAVKWDLQRQRVNIFLESVSNSFRAEFTTNASLFIFFELVT